MTPPASSRWLDAVRTLHTWKRGTQRAVHKPLFTLLLLARAQAGKGADVSYAEIREPLTRLLAEFGPPRRSHHPENPFWHLQSDGFWIVEGADAIPRKKDGRSIASSALLAADARGHVTAPFWAELRAEPALPGIVAEAILADYWPESLHASIREAVGLAPDLVVPSARRARDPNFREAVLRAYERRCAVCGYDGRLGNLPLGLEAAHIQWHAYAGPDDVANGLALCVFHHLALDKGALGISPAGDIQISTDVTGNTEATHLLLRFAGAPLRKPQSAFATPAARHVAWHTEQVFKAPARDAGHALRVAAEARGSYDAQ